MNELESKLEIFVKENHLSLGETKDIFLNHLKEFLIRVKNEEQIDEKVDKDLLKQIGSKNIILSSNLAYILSGNSKVKISDFEIFLISTHISILKNHNKEDNQLCQK